MYVLQVYYLKKYQSLTNFYQHITSFSKNIKFVTSKWVGVQKFKGQQFQLCTERERTSGLHVWPTSACTQVVFALPLAAFFCYCILMNVSSLIPFLHPLSTSLLFVGETRISPNDCCGGWVDRVNIWGTTLNWRGSISLRALVVRLKKVRRGRRV